LKGFLKLAFSTQFSLQANAFSVFMIAYISAYAAFSASARRWGGLDVYSVLLVVLVAMWAVLTRFSISYCNRSGNLTLWLRAAMYVLLSCALLKMMRVYASAVGAICIVRAVFRIVAQVVEFISFTNILYKQFVTETMRKDCFTLALALCAYRTRPVPVFGANIACPKPAAPKGLIARHWAMLVYSLLKERQGTTSDNIGSWHDSPLHRALALASRTLERSLAFSFIPRLRMCL
jgi:hypothetical protein